MPSVLKKLSLMSSSKGLLSNSAFSLRLFKALSGRIMVTAAIFHLQLISLSTAIKACLNLKPRNSLRRA